VSALGSGLWADPARPAALRPPGVGGARPLTPCPAKETGRRLTVGGLQDRVGRLSTSGPPTSPDPHVARRWSLAPFLLPCRGSPPTGSLREHHPPSRRPLRRRGAGSRARRRYSVTGEARLRQDRKNRRRGLRQSAIGVWGDTPVRTPNRVITPDAKPSAGSTAKAEPGARRSLPHAGPSPAACSTLPGSPSIGSLGERHPPQAARVGSGCAKIRCMDPAQVVVTIGGLLAIVGVLFFFFGPKDKKKP